MTNISTSCFNSFLMSVIKTLQPRPLIEGKVYLELTVSEDWSPLSSGWGPWQQAGRCSTQQCLSPSLLGHTHRERQEGGVLWNLQWAHTSQYFLSNPINWEHMSLGGHSLLNHHIAFPLLCTNWQPSVFSASMCWLFLYFTIEFWIISLKHNVVSFHSFCHKWQDFIVFFDWGLFCCMWVAHSVTPFTDCMQKMVSLITCCE